MPYLFSAGRLIISCLALFCLFASHQVKSEDNLVVLLYHHVDTKTPPSTSISPTQFAEHMAFLAANYQVVSLPDALTHIQNGESLPDKAVAITFDDGFKNILENGHPVLRQHQFPYTVFVNPGAIGTQRNQLTWDEVNLMQKQGATFANHTMDHLHLLERKEGETQQQWLTRVWQNIDQAEQLITERTGQNYKMLAYPFGEYDSNIQQMLEHKGYIGLGQHSGAINRNTDLTALPRFPAAGRYANLKTLKTKLNSLAFDSISSNIVNPDRLSDREFPLVQLSIDETDTRLGQAQCFFQGKSISLERKENLLEFAPSIPLPVGRSRVNCTSPSVSEGGRYYWFSQPFFVSDSTGRYPD